MTPPSRDIYDTDWTPADAVRTGAVPAATAALLFEIMEAAEAGSGELVVSSDEASAKIHFHDGRIAWIARDDQPHGFVEHLVRLGLASREELLDLVARCREERRPFTDALSDEGYLGPSAVHLALRDFLSRSLGDVLLWSDAEAVFAPSQRPFDGDLHFEPADLLRAAIEECLDVHDDPHRSSLVPADGRPGSCLEQT